MSKKFSTKPNYIRIQDELRIRILRGEWRPGEQIPTERELEEQFEASRLTINKSVAGLVSEGYLSRKVGKGTFVAELGANTRTAAAQLAPKLIRFIATVNDEDPWPVGIGAGSIQGIHDILKGSCYENAVDIYRKPEEQVRLLQRDDSPYYAGFILLYEPVAGLIEEFQRLKSRGFPFVLIDSYPSEVEVDFAVTDNILGTTLAVEHLAGLGHKRIAYITRPVDRSSLTDRLSGFIKGMILAGLPVANENVIRLVKYSKEAIPEVPGAVESLLNRPVPPTAIVFSNDDLAIEAWHYLRTRGINVPGDISIVGYDNVDRSGFKAFPLTTIAQDFYQMSKVAAQTILRKLQGVTEPEVTQVFIKPHIVVRESTKEIGG